ncbi:unnamed protein product [Caretta caretta]
MHSIHRVLATLLFSPRVLWKEQRKSSGTNVPSEYIGRLLWGAAFKSWKMKAPIPHLILLYATLTQSLKVVTKRGSAPAL